MFKIFYAENDATIYEGAPDYNTGLDEILEIGKRLGTDGSTLEKSRFIVKFNMSEITDTLTKYSVALTDCKFVLQLFTTHAKNLPADYTINANVVAQPWINGTGFENEGVAITDGITWAEPYASWSLDSQSGSLWISSSQAINIIGTDIVVSGSGEGGSWLWETGSVVYSTSSFDSIEDFSTGRNTDINMDVSNAIQLWISGSGGVSVDNNGFLLRFSDADESDETKTGYIRYFSRETHTIYVPKLTMYWDNSTFATGSLSAVDLESYLTYSKTKPTYKDTEVTKIRIYARDKFPRKSPENLYPLQTVKYLPSTTYYAIRDAATDEYIIPFDNIYNKVSCDSTSNFIYVDMNSFMPERYYRIELKIVDGFTEEYIDDQIYFKVVR